MLFVEKNRFYFAVLVINSVPDFFAENATRTVADTVVAAEAVAAAMGVATEGAAASDLYQMNLLTLHLSGICQTELFRAMSTSCSKS